MFDECVIRERRFAPARFCAPLAGYTHSPFRRLLAELGGCGAAWTEMLAGRQILNENFAASPYLRRRPAEKNLFYQLMVKAGDPFDRICGRLREHGVDAVDLNLACHAPNIRSCQAGSALFDDFEGLRGVLTQARQHWPGLLTVKIRLGHERPDWQTHFLARLQLIEDAGVDAVTVHPRFFEDKFKRRARLELLPWVVAHTRLPVIANGDLGSPAQVAEQAEHLRPAAAIMIGRQAVVRPWVFAGWEQPVPVDYLSLWMTLYDYVLEEFATAVALRRIQMFTKYFAANFTFGHQFYVAVSNAPDLETVRQRAVDFLSRAPATVRQPVPPGWS